MTHISFAIPGKKKRGGPAIVGKEREEEKKEISLKSDPQEEKEGGKLIFSLPGRPKVPRGPPVDCLYKGNRHVASTRGGKGRAERETDEPGIPALQR